MIRYTGKKLKTGLPNEPIVGNMVRRVMYLVREAYAACLDTEQRRQIAESGLGEVPKKKGMVSTSVSVQSMLLSPETSIDFSKQFKGLKSLVIQAINDLIEELEESTHNIASQALDHIHAEEYVMTYGCDATVKHFLLTAAKKRQFRVIVAECAPDYSGQDLAMSLGKEGIETTLITDSAVFAVMSRVNKVIIGTHLMLADGGLMAPNGCHALALAAKHHSVPVIVCSALYKLCPKYLCPYDQDAFNFMHSPAEIINYSDAEIVSKTSIAHPLFDTVPSDLVTLYVSNIGANAPSYTYRTITEYYNEEDYDDF